MIPILYAIVTEGTVPTKFGKGALSDVLSCQVTEQRNGSYELTMDYAAEGIHAGDIVPNAIIKAKPNYTDDPQLFRIYKVGKAINGRFTVNAQHISYDLSGKVIASGSAASCVAACALLEASAGNFTINTDKTVSAAFSVSEPSSVRSWFGGKNGSLLDVYGGEWKFDNYTASLKQARGTDRGVTIRYGKNLVDLSQVLNMSNLVTGVVPYYIDSSTKALTVGTKVPTGLTLDVDRDIAVDFSQDVDPESQTTISAQLATLAAAYIAKNNLTNIINSITLDFVQMQGLTERVDLCDTVNIYFEALGISAAAKCIATVWDVLEERYTKTTFGEAKTNIADTIAVTQKEVKAKASVSYTQEAARRASEMITGNLGGYVVFHDSDNNGQPDEILIMDTADINTATKVWRWNNGGLGYSGTGYAGPYTKLALTADGQIVADAITTGTLNADLIKAGTIQDVAGNSTIDMTNGSANMKDFKAKTSLSLVDASNIVRGLLSYSGAGGTLLNLVDPDNVTLISIQAKASGSGGHFEMYDHAGTQVAVLQATVNGSALYIFNKNGGNAGILLAGGAGDGTLNLFDGNGTNTINLSGQSGVVTCVSVTQTSSRKVKENIEPISDARKILELEAVAFDYKNKNLGNNKRGFIAEDVAEVLPNLVTKGETMSLDYIGMIPYLQAVIKEQDARIKKLEEKLNGTD